jgi:hypothetical protein
MFPVPIRYGNDGEAADAQQVEPDELGVGAHLVEWHGARQRADRDHRNGPRRTIAHGVRTGRATDANDSHGRPDVPGMVVQYLLAGLHRPQMAQRERVRDAVPFGGAVPQQVVEAVVGRLLFDQPVRHAASTRGPT